MSGAQMPSNFQNGYAYNSPNPNIRSYTESGYSYAPYDRGGAPADGTQMQSVPYGWNQQAQPYSVEVSPYGGGAQQVSAPSGQGQLTAGATGQSANPTSPIPWRGRGIPMGRGTPEQNAKVADIIAKHYAGRVPWIWSEPNNPLASDFYRYQQDPYLWMQHTQKANPQFAQAVQQGMAGITDPRQAIEKWSDLWNERFAGTGGLAPNQWRNGFRGVGMREINQADGGRSYIGPAYGADTTGGLPDPGFLQNAGNQNNQLTVAGTMGSIGKPSTGGTNPGTGVQPPTNPQTVAQPPTRVFKPIQPPNPPVIAQPPKQIVRQPRMRLSQVYGKGKFDQNLL